MKLFRTEKTKDNLSKSLWDMGKVIFTLSVVGPLVNFPSVTLSLVLTGLGIGILFWIIAFIIDNKGGLA